MAEPDAPLAFTLRSPGDDEIDTSGVSVVVDGSDVTAACEVRRPQTWPADRADYAYRPVGGWSPGRHEVTVAWGGRISPQSWEFAAR